MLLGRILATNIDILMPRVEELLAVGDADVEDLDTDGQSLIECFSYFLLFSFRCNANHSCSHRGSSATCTGFSTNDY